MRNLKKYSVAMAVLAAVSTTAACGSSDDSSSAKSDTSKESTSTAPSDDSMDSDSGMDPAADLVGPGCGDYAKAVPDGAGSVAGMAQDPVAVAASNNPLLKTLVAAVSGKVNPKVNLVDTLNGDEFTVFAPVDEAFGKVPPKTMATLQKDPELLTKVLTYHVIPGQIAPADITGTHKTVEGDTVKVTGSGDNLKVDGASVICGGVHTANATVYLIDGVLQPKM
jgi:uncharacterized surface protein with fasciclin (FAS1) repeats